MTHAVWRYARGRLACRPQLSPRHRFHVQNHEVTKSALVCAPAPNINNCGRPPWWPCVLSVPLDVAPAVIAPAAWTTPLIACVEDVDAIIRLLCSGRLPRTAPWSCAAKSNAAACRRMAKEPPPLWADSKSNVSPPCSHRESSRGGTRERRVML